MFCNYTLKTPYLILSVLLIGFIFHKPVSASTTTCDNNYRMELTIESNIGVHWHGEAVDVDNNVQQIPQNGITWGGTSTFPQKCSDKNSSGTDVNMCNVGMNEFAWVASYYGTGYINICQPYENANCKTTDNRIIPCPDGFGNSNGSGDNDREWVKVTAVCAQCSNGAYRTCFRDKPQHPPCTAENPAIPPGYSTWNIYGDYDYEIKAANVPCATGEQRIDMPEPYQACGICIPKPNPTLYYCDVPTDPAQNPVVKQTSSFNTVSECSATRPSAYPCFDNISAASDSCPERLWYCHKSSRAVLARFDFNTDTTTCTNSLRLNGTLHPAATCHPDTIAGKTAAENDPTCKDPNQYHYCHKITGEVGNTPTDGDSDEAVWSIEECEAKDPSRNCYMGKTEALNDPYCRVCCDVRDWTVRQQVYIPNSPTNYRYKNICLPKNTANELQLEPMCIPAAENWWQARGGMVYGEIGLISQIPVYSQYSTPRPNDRTYCSETNNCSPYLIARGCNSIWTADTTTYSTTASYPLTGGTSISAIETRQRKSTGTFYNATYNPKTNRNDQNTSAQPVFYGPKEDYRYLINLLPQEARNGILGSTSPMTLDSLKNCGDVGAVSGDKKACTFNGNLTIADGTNFTVPTLHSYTVFVTENLIIGSNVSYPLNYENDNAVSIKVANGGYLSFIVQGDIIIKPQVGYRNNRVPFTYENGAISGVNLLPQFGTPVGSCSGGGYQEVGVIQGVYIANGKIKIEKNNAGTHIFLFTEYFYDEEGNITGSIDHYCDGRFPDKKFIGEGTFVAWGDKLDGTPYAIGEKIIELNRSFDDECTGTKLWHNTSPTEAFNYRPDFLQNAPTWLWRSIRLRLERV